MAGAALRLLDLPDELLRAIAAGCGSQGLGGLLGACRHLNALLRPQLGAAWLRAPSGAAAAARALSVLRPWRFAGLRSAALRSDAALACDLERLQVWSGKTGQRSRQGQCSRANLLCPESAPAALLSSPQLLALEQLELENVLLCSFGFNDITHLAALTRLTVDTYACGRSAALGEDSTLGALQVSRSGAPAALLAAGCSVGA